MSSYSKVRAEDGTMLRAWTNDATGIPVVISNGLGASPTAWPALAAPDSGFRVVTWHHRGLGGSERPARAEAIRVEDFASDLGAVMASAGMEHALIVGWSFGVNAAFEFARLQPGRTAGLLAVAGVPGGSLGAMYGPMRIPRPLREPAGQISAQLLPVTGPWLTIFAAAMPRRYPAQRSDADAIAQEAAHVPALRLMLREFAAHDWEWYSRLAVALGEHARDERCRHIVPRHVSRRSPRCNRGERRNTSCGQHHPRSSGAYPALRLALATAAVSRSHTRGTAQARAKKQPPLNPP